MPDGSIPLPPIPEILTRLQQNAKQVLAHLFPNTEPDEDGDLFYNRIKVNTNNLRWFDYEHNIGGELHDLWRHVKGQTFAEAKADINQFLLNVDSPDGMKRFDFSPEQMRDTDSLYGDCIEVFPEVNFYCGTTTLLGGYNGSGKSTLATQIAHICAQSGVKGFILSPEMPPKVTGHIMTRQATNVGEPTNSEWTLCANHVRENFLFSTTEDRITPDVVKAQFDAAYAKGYRLMILDSITCVRAGHENHQQANFADDLRSWSRAHPDCYLLVLAHMRKPAGYQGGMISRYDIRGAGEISDLAGHVWLLQRKNPFSQKEMAEYGDFSARIIVDKNRATGKLACKMLRFSNIQKLYHPSKQCPRYVDNVMADNIHLMKRQ